MDPIKKAIRNALEKGDATDEAFRERVYQSAFSSLERALSGRQLSPEQVEQRRDRLRASIVEIESEFAPALPEIEVDEDGGDWALSAPEALALDPDDRIDAGRPTQPKARRGNGARIRPATILLVALAGLLLLLAAVWWIVFGGFSAAPGSPDAPPAISGSGPASGVTQVPSDQDWIRVFVPEDASNVALGGGATANIMAEEGQTFLRIESDGEAEVRFGIGQGILEQMAGNRVMISIQARAGEGETAEFAIECQLAELGDCGRKRFEIGPTISEFLFEIVVPAGSPRQSGALILRPAIGGSGAIIDIQAIRTAVAAS